MLASWGVAGQNMIKLLCDVETAMSFVDDELRNFPFFIFG